MIEVQNAFTMVRPRGQDLDIQAAAPRKTTNTSGNSEFGSVKAMDRTGRRTVGMAPRTTGGISIENSEQGKSRAAAQLEGLQTKYTAEKDPAKQAEIARQIRAMQGKADPAEWAVQVTPTTKNQDGSSSEGSVIRYNKATGQAERVDVGQSAKTTQQFKQGEVYRDAAGNTRRWNGAAWEKV